MDLYFILFSTEILLLLRYLYIIYKIKIKINTTPANITIFLIYFSCDNNLVLVCANASVKMKTLSISNESNRYEILRKYRAVKPVSGSKNVNIANV